MFRKLTLGLAAAATLGLGGAALTPAPAAAGHGGVSIGIHLGHPGYYHGGYYKKRFYKPVRDVCTVKRVKRVRRNGTVVYKTVRRCRPSHRYYW